MFLHPVDGFIMPHHTIGGHVVIGVRRPRHERNTPVRNRIGRIIDIVRSNGDVLDAFTIVLLQIGHDLAFLAPIFVERNADTATGRGQRAGKQPGKLAFDIKNLISLKLNRSP